MELMAFVLCYIQKNYQFSAVIFKYPFQLAHTKWQAMLATVIDSEVRAKLNFPQW